MSPAKKNKREVDHRRFPKVVMISASEIKADPDFRHDENFIKLFQLCLLGKANVALTRIDEKQIVSGFYVHSRGIVEHVSNLKPENTELVVRLIRAGDRPSLHVYWSGLRPGTGGWVCPDDETALAAYRQLGISLVPCKILKPLAVPQEEAMILIVGKNDVPRYKRAIAPKEAPGCLSFFGDHSPPAARGINLLKKRCQQVRAEVKAFHVEADHLHYNQMIYAVVARHERAIDSVARLIATRRSEHAAAIVRAAYEAFLNFYVDWLSPTFFGPRLQLLSILRTESHTGLSADSVGREELEKKLGGFQSLLEVAAQKARISPLGELFHNLAYPPLSSIMHQSYGILEREADTFYKRSSDRKELRDALVKWLDVITAALLVRVCNDVGSTTIKIPEAL